MVEQSSKNIILLDAGAGTGMLLILHQRRSRTMR
jgi:tRNA1(Val) A37 N6-methylase TrmN6